ncbi:MAG: phosphoribosyltransferase family protein, partial [Desulfobacteraceae bacterium]|nr:phosphoribosyltransferase family protein [Desulfobacteraceae bacterium]
MPQFIPVIQKHEIQRQIRRVAETISTDYRGRELVLIGVLKGAFLFLADLARELKLEKVKIDFLQASSYGADTVSSENIVLRKDIDVDIRGKDVLVVEDIVDTGLTLAYLIRHLKGFGPKSVKVCTMIDKS